MKSILFLHIPCYGYISKIKDELLNNNFSVDLFSIYPNLNIIEKILKTIFPKYITIKNRILQKKLINSLIKSNKQYDYVFVLVGRGLETQTLSKLRKIYPCAKFILYLWDDVARVENILEKLEYFDIIYSSDSKDIKKYGFRFLPLFYCNEFVNKSNFEKKERIFSCGTLHSNRLFLFKKICEFSKKYNFEYDLVLNCSILYYLKFYFSLKKKDIYSFISIKSISLSECAERTKIAKVIVDMPYNTQSGLSIRTFEALAAQTKIITTNEHIKEYDFYCPGNVMIIDRENPVFDVDFIMSPYKPIPKEIVEKYSLENWIKTIFLD